MYNVPVQLNNYLDEFHRFMKWGSYGSYFSDMRIRQIITDQALYDVGVGGIANIKNLQNNC